MISFRYGDFYDVPRTIALRYRGKLFLLQSAFDEQIDEYPDEYTVYMLPESCEAELARGSWEFLEEAAAERLGQIRIKDVCFDSTKRKHLDASILDEFVR